MSPMASVRQLLASTSLVYYTQKTLCYRSQLSWDLAAIEIVARVPLNAIDSGIDVGYRL